MHLTNDLFGRTMPCISIIALVFAFVLCGCGATDVHQSDESPAAVETDTEEQQPDDAATEDASAVDEIAEETESDGEVDIAEEMTEEVTAAASNEDKEQPEEEAMLRLSIGSEEVTVAWEDNEAVDALKELAASEPLTIDLSMYGGFEQVGPIGTSLPAADEQITTQAGDIVLYAGDQISVFYGTNTWAYTMLGHITEPDENALAALLSNGDTSLTLFTGQEGDEVGVFDFSSKTVKLNSGYEMPIMGLGTYSLDHDTCVNSVKALLGNGGRLIDTAYMYHNEEAVGEGVRQAMEEYGIPREDIFVITKIYPNQFDDPEAAIDMALEKLDIGYIDMMLLHHPGTGDVEAYLAMEQYVEQGKIRSIGLSNWYVEELTEFLPQVHITPALVQNEIHPYYQEQEVVPFIQDKGIVMQGWYPLGGRGHTAELLGDETIMEIANVHGVSAAQVILRWNLQRGIVVIPGSSNPDHIKENLDLFGFELTEEEMERIAALDRDEKHDWY